MDFTKVIQSRYSCRGFLHESVKREHLGAILEAGRLAPTAKNLQEQRIYVVESAEGLEKIDAHTRCRFGAPTVLVVAYDKDNVYTYPDTKRQSGIEDASIVATHMMLAAANEGVGSLWINAVNADTLHEALGLPENEDIVMLLALGYPDEKGKKPAERHFQRKVLEETVTYI